MPNIPQIRIGSTDYNIRDEETRINLEHVINHLPDADDPTVDYLSRRGIWTLNRINDSTGQDQNNGNLSRTDNYIEVTGDRIDYHIKATGKNYAIALYMYDASKQFLGELDTDYYSTDYVGTFYPVHEDTKYVRLSVYKQNEPKFNSVSEVTDNVEIWQYRSNFDMSSLSFVVGESLTCNNDLSGFRSIWSERFASSGYYPVGKGTRFMVRYQSGDSDQYLADNLYIYTFDENYNLTGFMNPDTWNNHWEAEDDCYIRMLVRHSKTMAMTQEHLAIVLGRISAYYISPTNSNFTVHEYANTKPAATTFLKGVSLWSPTGSNKNEFEFNNNQRVMVNYFPVGKGTFIRMDTALDNGSDIREKMCLYQYDKNFKFLKESYDWEIDDIISQDGYARLALRRGNYAVSDSDVTWLYNHLYVNYIAPTDRDLYENLSTRIENATLVTMHNIYGDRISEVTAQYAALAEPGRLGYIWVSDFHITHHAYHYSFNKHVVKRVLSAVKEAAESSRLDFICVGGDLYNQNNVSVADALRMAYEALVPLKNCSVPVIVLFGNHDDNSYGGATKGSLTIPWEKAMAAIPQRSDFHNDIQFVDTSKGYYYFDIPAKHKRVICLNGSDPSGVSDRNTRDWWTISQEQVVWFCDVASATPYDMIILTHTQPGTKYEFENRGDENGYYTDLGNAIAANNLGTSITLYGVEHSFSGHGKVKFIHCGHTHFDLDPEEETYIWGGVPVITTSCVKAWDQYIGENECTEVTAGSDLYYYTQAQAEAAHANTYGWKFYLWTDRKFGTINESIIDMVSVNSDNVHTFRIGAGHDRDYSI